MFKSVVGCRIDVHSKESTGLMEKVCKYNDVLIFIRGAYFVIFLL